MRGLIRKAGDSFSESPWYKRPCLSSDRQANKQPVRVVGQVKELHEGHGFVVDNAAPTDMLYFDYSHNPLVSSVALSRTMHKPLSVGTHVSFWIGKPVWSTKLQAMDMQQLTFRELECQKKILDELE